MKYCQGLRSENIFYDLLMDMEPKGWELAKQLIRKHTAAMALKADLVEHRPRGQGYVVNNMSGANRSQANLLESKGKSMTKAIEEETEHNREKEETHHKAGETAETTATQDFTSTAMKCQHVTQQIVPNRQRKKKAKI